MTVKISDYSLKSLAGSIQNKKTGVLHGQQRFPTGKPFARLPAYFIKNI